MPQRIQLSRKKGYRKPEGAIVVARPTKWGNPWKLGQRGITDTAMDRTAVVTDYRDALTDRLAGRTTYPYPPAIHYAAEHLLELRGHDLACWCSPQQACHADVLLELANG